MKLTPFLLAIVGLSLLAACSAAPMRTEVSSSSRMVPGGLDPVEGVWEGAPATPAELAAEREAREAEPTAASWTEPVAAATQPPAPVAAQRGEASAHDVAQANNPLANFTALSFHNYYIPDVTDAPDVSMNTFWLRFAKPIEGWLIRASLPLNRVPTSATTSESGLGDLNAFAAYIMSPEDSPVTYGVGPMLTLPTASDDALGSGKWQLGAAAVYFNANSSEYQFGGLVTYQTDFAGPSSRADVSLFAVQPFLFYQLGGGSYLRSAGVMAFNWENGNYNVPIGAGFGKVFKLKSGNVLNAFIEPQFTILEDGSGQPSFQVFFGLNTQFI